MSKRQTFLRIKKDINMTNLKIGKFILGMAQTNCYFIYLDNGESKEAIVIDPADRGDYIYEKLEEKGLKIAGIMLTHGHFDHILGVNKLRDLSGAKVYACEAEKEICEDAGKNISAEIGRSLSVEADVYLGDGAEFTLGGMFIRLIATPGHTAGGACYYFPEAGVLVSGDTLFKGSVGRTDFPTGSMAVLTRSIREKLFVLPDETKVYPGHGEATWIGFERENNPFV